MQTFLTMNRLQILLREQIDRQVNNCPSWQNKGADQQLGLSGQLVSINSWSLTSAGRPFSGLSVLFRHQTILREEPNFAGLKRLLKPDSISPLDSFPTADAGEFFGSLNGNKCRQNLTLATFLALWKQHAKTYDMLAICSVSGAKLGWANSWHLGWWGKQMCRLKYLYWRDSEGLRAW